MVPDAAPIGSRRRKLEATLIVRQCLRLCPSVCPQHGLPRVDNVRAMLQSLQRREPRRLPACSFTYLVLTSCEEEGEGAMC